MSGKAKEKIVPLDGYHFVISGRRIIVPTRRKDKEELKVITELYRQYKRFGRPFAGEFRLCQNPECRNAFYTSQGRIKDSEAKFCSHSCTSKVFLTQKKQGPDKAPSQEEEPEIVYQEYQPVMNINPREIVYQEHQLVMNINPREDLICGTHSIYRRTGEVIGVSDVGVKVDFKEPGKIKRVYYIGDNLDYIAPVASKQ
jgi:hypothetical protein